MTSTCWIHNNAPMPCAQCEDSQQLMEAIFRGLENTPGVRFSYVAVNDDGTLTSVFVKVPDAR